MYSCEICGFQQEEPGICPTCGISLTNDSGETEGESKDSS